MWVIARTLEVAGEICVAFVAVSVHHRVLKEHKIDSKVFRAMRHEQLVGGIGIILIIAGFVMELIFAR